MSDPLRIVVITHALDSFEGANYLLNRLMENWPVEQAQVAVHADPHGTPPPADIAIAHIDRTVVSGEYLQVFDQYPKVINGSVKDISKSLVSNNVLRRDENYDGPVIVKTERNFGGVPELRERQLKGDQSFDPDPIRPWGRVDCLNEYPVFDSADQVPLGVWRNRNLIVDKFRPEKRDNGEYALRVWIFLGDASLHYQCISNEPIIKSGNTIRREMLDTTTVPEELIAKRAEMDFEYGKFDYGIVDGQVALYDVNKTPGGGGRDALDAQSIRNIRNLSQGIYSFAQAVGNRRV